MNSLIVLTALPYYKQVIERIEEVIPKSSIIWVNNNTKDETLFRLDTKPFYSDVYYVMVDLGYRMYEFQKVQKYLDHPWVRMVFLCPSKGIYNSMRDKLIECGKGYDLFNCYGVSFFAKIAFVKKCMRSALGPDFKIDNKLVSYIAKRISGYENSLEHILVTAANGKDKITRTAIRRLMPDKKYLTVNNFMLTLLTTDPVDTETVKLVKNLITRYRYYVTPLNRSVRDFFNTWEELYIEHLQGKFNELTYIHWLANNGQKYGISSEYVAKMWLNLLSKYSYEFMYSMKLNFNSAYKKNPLCGYVYLILVAKEMLGIQGLDEVDGVSDE